MLPDLYRERLLTFLKSYASLGFQPMALVPPNLVGTQHYCITFVNPATGLRHTLLGTYQQHVGTILALKAGGNNP